MNVDHFEWLESASPNDRHGRDALDFRNRSGCEQFVRCPTYIAGNRFDLVMTDVPDIVDVFEGSPLGISDHCFVSCVLRVEQSVPEFNQKYRLSEASYQLGQCPLCSQELILEHHFEGS